MSNNLTMTESEQVETISVGSALLAKVQAAIRKALAYEAATGWRRKLGITDEVGEVLACSQFGLQLVLDPRAQGFDAIDAEGNRVQIKTRRSESEGLPRGAGRTGTFSQHPFDYALLVLLDRQYRVAEVWRADYRDLKPVIERQKRRNPNLAAFKRLATRVFPAGSGLATQDPERMDDRQALRGAVMYAWKEAGQPTTWGLARTLNECVSQDEHLASRGLNPARRFRQAWQRKDQRYLARWVLGCRFPWLTKSMMRSRASCA